MHSGKLNNTLGKPMKQLISRLKETWVELSQENNPLNQLEIYGRECQFIHSKSNTVTKLGFELLKFL